MRVSPPWLQEHEAHNHTLWETFTDQHHKMRRTAQVIRLTVTRTPWKEGALWGQHRNTLG